MLARWRGNSARPDAWTTAVRRLHQVGACHAPLQSSLLPRISRLNQHERDHRFAPLCGVGWFGNLFGDTDDAGLIGGAGGVEVEVAEGDGLAGLPGGP